MFTLKQYGVFQSLGDAVFKNFYTLRARECTNDVMH